MSIGRRRWKRISLAVLVLFLSLNTIAAFHAWRFTHFTEAAKKPAAPQNLVFLQKLKIAFTGVAIPRPTTKALPRRAYQTISLHNDVLLDAWYMNTAMQPAKGTVILFHGYGGEKSDMLGKAYILMDIGYNVLLPDFRGAGPSGGNSCTIGYKEARDVNTCYDYIQSKGEKHIILLGTSMGAAAVLKYIHDSGAQPSGLILECPFGTMYKTVCIRFKMMHFPPVPMAGLLVLWGGIENGFWAFDHSPEDYAKAVRCPTLLMFGDKDDRVSRGEIDAVYRNLGGAKTLRTFPEAGHNNYLTQYRTEWTDEVTRFTANISHPAQQEEK